MLLRCLDIETTGLAPPEHAVCEIGWCDVVREGETWRVASGGSMLVDPGRPIPPETSAVHHIVDEDVQGARPFADALRDVLHDEAAMAAPKVVLVAHNARFERLWLTDELMGGLPWICTYKSALRLWQDAPLHSNQGLRYWRRPEGLDRDLARLAHRAFPDAYVTAHHVRDMLELASVEDLLRWTSEPAALIRCQFGKHRGARWMDVPTDYLRWCVGQGMEPDVAFTVRRELDRRIADARAGL